MVRESKMKVQSYKELDVWKKGLEIVDFVYRITEKFPSGERFGLTTQTQRAAVSVSSNIAEGFCRQYSKEFIQFLFVARGSCAELETQLIIAKKRNYIGGDDFVTLMDYIDHELKMLMNLIKSLKRRSTLNAQRETA